MLLSHFWLDHKAGRLQLESRETIEQKRNSAPDVLDDDMQIITRLLRLISPIGEDLMHVQNRLIDAVTEVIEERDLSSEFPANPCLVVLPHRNGNRSGVDQGLGELSLPVAGRVDTLFQERSQHDGMDLLR